MDDTSVRFRKLESEASERRMTDKKQLHEIQSQIRDTKNMLGTIVSTLEIQKKQIDEQKRAIELLAKMPQITPVTQNHYKPQVTVTRNEHSRN